MEDKQQSILTGGKKSGGSDSIPMANSDEISPSKTKSKFFMNIKPKEEV